MSKSCRILFGGLRGGAAVSSYGDLAAWYDQLTGDVDYAAFADFYEESFRRNGGEFHLLLDLCCGTGTLAVMLGGRGYEMIGVDASIDMLMQAREKGAALPVPPLFLCQRAEELDLYGTVDAAFCSLDGMNYLSPEDLPEVFRRLHLFIRPGGLLIFDIREPEWLKTLDGQIFLDENDELLCLWRASYDPEENAVTYGMDLFERQGELWSRSGEEHIEYAHEPEALLRLLAEAGFQACTLRRDCPQGDAGRLFITAIRGEQENG